MPKMSWRRDSYPLFSNSVSEASEKGKKPKQEDKYFADVWQDDEFGTFWMFAVADGHNGDAVSEIATLRLPSVFAECLFETNGDFESALVRAFADLRELTGHLDSSSTLSCVVVSENEERAYVAVLGDSPVIAMDKHGVISVSPQLSRTLGSELPDETLNREPETYTFELGPGSAVITASSGIWDEQSEEVHEDQAFELLKKVYMENYTAEGLVRNALSYSKDNVTAVVWKRNP